MFRVISYLIHSGVVCIIRHDQFKPFNRLMGEDFEVASSFRYLNNKLSVIFLNL